MPQFFVHDDGLLSEVEATNQADWYSKLVPGADPLSFEAHLMIMRANAALRIDAPFYSRGGLTKARYNLLRLLYQADDYRMLMTEIVQGMNVSPTNITKLVDGLEKDGYVQRVGNETDKRKVWVELTPTGHTVLLGQFPEVVRHVVGLWTGVSSEEKRILVHLLAKVRLSILTSKAHEQVSTVTQHAGAMPQLEASTAETR
jgi:DNA-binding MarR family transcriptional regulator